MNFSQLLPLPIAEPWPLVRPKAGGQYEIVAELPAGLRDLVRLQDDRRATVIPESRDRIELFEWVVGSLSHKTISLPEDMYATDVILAGKVLFVSGGYRWPTQSEEILISRPIEGGEWTSLDIPKHCRRPGKIVDALLLDGPRLIAVDNTIKPKWFIEYHVGKADRPMLLGTPEIRHEPNEHAQSAALGSRFIAVRSVAATNNDFSRYVRLYDRQWLTECAYLTASHKPTTGSYLEVDSALGRDQRVSLRQWHEVAFVGDTLFIAGGLDGLGIVDTRSIKSIERTNTPNRLPPPAYLGEEEVRFEPPASGHEVVAVIPAPQHLGCFAIEAREDARSVRWHPIVR